METELADFNYETVAVETALMRDSSKDAMISKLYWRPRREWRAVIRNTALMRDNSNRITGKIYIELTAMTDAAQRLIGPLIVQNSSDTRRTFCERNNREAFRGGVHFARHTEPRRWAYWMRNDCRRIRDWRCIDRRVGQSRRLLLCCKRLYSKICICQLRLSQPCIYLLLTEWSLLCRPQEIHFKSRQARMTPCKRSPAT